MDTQRGLRGAIAGGSNAVNLINCLRGDSWLSQHASPLFSAIDLRVRDEAAMIQVSVKEPGAIAFIGN